jgi:hypothetical protein
MKRLLMSFTVKAEMVIFCIHTLYKMSLKKRIVLGHTKRDFLPLLLYYILPVRAGTDGSAWDMGKMVIANNVPIISMMIQVVVVDNIAYYPLLTTYRFLLT